VSFLSKIKKGIESIESSSVPFTYILLTFCSAVFLRNILESFSTGVTVSFNTFSHFSYFFISIALSLILLFRLALGHEVGKIARIILPSFLVLLLPPIVDLILSSGKGYSMSYLLPGRHGDLLTRFITFTGDFSGSGITPGMKTEIALILAASLVYFYSKTSRILKSLVCVFLIYLLFFLYALVPFFVEWCYGLFERSHSFSSQDFIYLYLFFIYVQGIVLVYLSNKRYFRLAVKDIRIFRLIHYTLMFALGIVLGLKSDMFTLTFRSIFHFLFIPISILFASLFSVITNNITDLKIDRVSNPDRLLANNMVEINDYKRMAWCFLIVSLFTAAMVNFMTFFMISVCIAGYFLYSMPPVRFKRVPLLSKLVISFNSLMMVMLGFSIVHGSRVDFPNVLYPILLIGFTIATNFIDLKDYEGDRQAGIKTIPTLLGLRKSKIIIGLFFLFSYIFASVKVGNLYLSILLIAIGVSQLLFMVRSNYDERPVFVLYLFSLVLLISYLTRF
jgi:4-hydroxybenzoate polyprenyltransferase